MKVFSVTFWVILSAVLAISTVDGSRSSDRTITKVVKLLQKMLAKSQEDAEKDRLLYAKYRCYVDKNEAEKKQSITDLTAQIELLNSQIAGLQAENAELSAQVAALDRDMTANKAAQKSATSIRDASKKNFEQLEEDLTQGIGQMTEAVDVLDSLKLAQSKTVVHKKETVLLSLGSKARASLTAVSALLPPEKRQALEAFLQSPLSAAHAAKGDGIVEVLKKLQSTFEKNLKNAQKTDAAEQKAFEETIETLESSWGKMDKMKGEKEAKLGDNSQALSDKSGQLESAEQQKKDDEEFLATLLKDAKEKEKGHEERKMLRANEEAAISEAIAILNSDAAFDTFGSVKATSEGSVSFLQLRQLRGGAVLEQAENLLMRAAASGHSKRLARVADSLRAGHAFTAVMDEIDKMKKVIEEEAQADQDNFDWCKSEDTRNEKDLEAKKSQIKTLETGILELEKTIGSEESESGLVWDIIEKEKSLVENQENQKKITEQRKQEHVAYQKNVADLQEAEDLLGKAVKVLERYYKALEDKTYKSETGFLQEDPTPPELYGDFEGQKSDGNKAIEQLQFILGETKKEHEEADKTEDEAQKSFEEEMGSVEDMTGLKGDEKQMQEDLVTLKEDLAQSRKDLKEKEVDLKDTKAAKAAIEAYMAEIKPGCDFIKENKDLRDENRATEKKALEKAEKLIKDTPAYKKAVAKAEDKCSAQCKLDNTSLNCKACMSGSTKEDYCKNHPGTAGCGVVSNSK